MAILEIAQKYGSYKEIAPGEYAGPCPQCGGAMRFRIYPVQNRGACLSCEFSVTDSQEAEPVTKEFAADRLRQLISDTFSRVQSLCPEGAQQWLDQHRPDVTGCLVQIGKDVDAAFEAEDEPALLKALATWEKWHLAAWQRYLERPQVIERQEEL